MSTVPNFLDFTINAVHRPTFIRKLCYKLPSIVFVTFTFIQIFYIKIVPSLLNGIKVATFAGYSIKICIILGVRFERQKVDKKKQIYMKTEACKLYCRIFWIFLPNFINDPCNFELYRFKVGAFFRQSVETCKRIGATSLRLHFGFGYSIILAICKILLQFKGAWSKGPNGEYAYAYSNWLSTQNWSNSTNTVHHITNS